MGPGQQQNAHAPPPVRGQKVHPGKVLGVRPDPALRSIQGRRELSLQPLSRLPAGLAAEQRMGSTAHALACPVVCRWHCALRSSTSCDRSTPRQPHTAGNPCSRQTQARRARATPVRSDTGEHGSGVQEATCRSFGPTWVSRMSRGEESVMHPTISHSARPLHSDTGGSSPPTPSARAAACSRRRPGPPSPPAALHCPLSGQYAASRAPLIIPGTRRGGKDGEGQSVWAGRLLGRRCKMPGQS